MLIVHYSPCADGIKSWATCTPCINWPEANINCGIWDGNVSLVVPHKLFASWLDIDVLQLAFIWPDSIWDDDDDDEGPKLKFNGEFKHDAAAKPTNDNFCCWIDAKFCRFWKLNIFCTEIFEWYKRIIRRGNGEIVKDK